MKKTRVMIRFNGATIEYYFERTLEDFMPIWNNQIAGQGYFTGVDRDGILVSINPACCPIVEITEIDW